MYKCLTYYFNLECSAMTDAIESYNILSLLKFIKFYEKYNIKIFTL